MYLNSSGQWRGAPEQQRQLDVASCQDEADGNCKDPESLEKQQQNLSVKNTELYIQIFVHTPHPQNFNRQSWS